MSRNHTAHFNKLLPSPSQRGGLAGLSPRLRLIPLKPVAACLLTLKTTLTK